MEINYDLRINMPIPPGETIMEYLDTYSMTQKELSQRIDMSPKAINETISGKTSLTPQFAIKLESVFDVPASFWNNLEVSYREKIIRIEQLENAKKEIKFLELIPYNEIAKLGWINNTKNEYEKIFNLRKFFAVSSLENLDTVMDIAFRKKEAESSSVYSLITWLRKGEIDALKIETEDFNKEYLFKNIENFRKLTLLSINDAIVSLQQLCSQCGIALAIVPHLKKTYVNGATKWINETKAMIEVSKRYKYIDIFWFTFFHELGHLLKHSKKEYFIDENYDSGRTNKELEDEADDFAANTLIPKKEYMDFLTKNRYFDNKIIVDFARKINISPCIVVGRLCHDKVIPHNNHSSLRPKFC